MLRIWSTYFLKNARAGELPSTNRGTVVPLRIAWNLTPNLLFLGVLTIGHVSHAGTARFVFHTLGPGGTPPTVLGYLSPVGARIDLQWIEPADVTKIHHFWRPPPAEMGGRLIKIYDA